MTITEYKEKFVELAKQLQEEHGHFEEIRIESVKSEIGGALDLSTLIHTYLRAEIDF